MATVVKVMGFEAIYDATISTPDTNGIVTIDGNIYKVNPNLEHANTAAAYSNDVAVDFPPIAEAIQIKVIQSRIQSVGEHV